MTYKEYQFFSSNSVDQKYVTFPIRGNAKCHAFRINEVCIPLSYSTTDSSNNQLVFERSGSVKTATVPHGNHNAVTFVAALKKALNDAADVKNFDVTYNELTRSLTISADTTFTIHPFSQGSTMYRQIGMKKYQGSASGTSVTFGVADVTNTAPLLLTSSHLTSKNVMFVSEANINVLCMIDVSSPQNSVCKWVNHRGNFIEADLEIAQVDFTILNSATLKPVDLSQPFSVIISMVTDPDDLALVS
jgi:hypothetical protein